MTEPQPPWPGTGAGEETPAFPFDELRRAPDPEAPNLFAVDASDRLILDEALPQLSAEQGDAIVVIGDRYGALTLGVAGIHGATGIRVLQDRLAGEQALERNARHLRLDGRYRPEPLGEALLRGARVVLLQLPRSLAELDETAAAIVRFADPGVTVVAGGRIKHLSRAMNQVLERHFHDVHVTLARQKSRALVARRPRADDETTPDARSYPETAFHPELGLTVAAHGGAFAATDLDIGTRFLLGFLDRIAPDARHAIDLGCGTGILGAVIARDRPGLTVIATDQSQGAVRSAEATMTLNALQERVSVVRDLGLSLQPDASADVIVCNPPFHVGSEVHAGVALSMFRDAGRVLRPGGQLFTVFNSHLAYLADLRRLVGPTVQLGQNAKFTVTLTTARG